MDEGGMGMQDCMYHFILFDLSGILMLDSSDGDVHHDKPSTCCRKHIHANEKNTTSTTAKRHAIAMFHL
jgi:hypothetical protein